MRQRSRRGRGRCIRPQRRRRRHGSRQMTITVKHRQRFRRCIRQLRHAPRRHSLTDVAVEHSGARSAEAAKGRLLPVVAALSGFHVADNGAQGYLGASRELRILGDGVDVDFLGVGCVEEGREGEKSCDEGVHGC